MNQLFAPSPHPSLGEHAETYGRFIGSWRGELQSGLVKDATARQTVEIHFAWALEGRAVQDLWITPARTEREAGVSALLPPLDWYGTTLRVFEPASQSWKVSWFNPLSGGRIDLVGTRQGDDVVQLGTRQGRPLRWVFRDVQPNAFTWQGHSLQDDGVTWLSEVEIRATRA